MHMMFAKRINIIIKTLYYILCQMEMQNIQRMQLKNLKMMNLFIKNRHFIQLHLELRQIQKS